MDPILITVLGPRGAQPRRSASNHADPDVVRRSRPSRAGKTGARTARAGASSPATASRGRDAREQ